MRCKPMTVDRSYYQAIGVIFLFIVLAIGAVLGIKTPKAQSQFFSVIWTKATNNPGLKVSYAGAVVFNDTMWLISGARPQGGPCVNNPGCLSNAIWSSTDGINWTQRGNGPWAPRFGQAAVAFNGKIYVIGGGFHTEFRETYADVWSSSDGVTWTNIGSIPEPRAMATALVDSTRGKMVVIGGVRRNGSNVPVDAYESSDGITWTRLGSASTNPKWLPAIVDYSGRLYNISEAPTCAATCLPGGMLTNRGIVYAGAMWSIGGYQSAGQGKVWRSCDGAGWTLEEPFGGIGWYRRQGHQVLYFQNRMWVLGGIDGTTAQVGQAKDDAWYSPVDPGPAQYGCGGGGPPGGSPNGVWYKDIVSPVSGSIHNGQTITYKLMWNVINVGPKISIRDALPVADLSLVVGSPQFCTSPWSCAAYTDYSTRLESGKQVIHFNQLQSQPNSFLGETEVSIKFSVLFQPANPLVTGQPPSSSCSSPLVNSDVNMYNASSVPVGGTPFGIGYIPPSIDVYCSWVDKQYFNGSTWVDSLTGSPGQTIPVRLVYVTRSSTDGASPGSAVPPNTWRMVEFPKLGNFETITTSNFSASFCNNEGGCTLSPIPSGDITIVPPNGSYPNLVYFRRAGSGQNADEIRFNLKILSGACVSGQVLENKGLSYAVNTNTVYFEDQANVTIVCPSTGTITKTGPATVRVTRVGTDLPAGSITYTISGSLNSTAGLPVTIEDTMVCELVYSTHSLIVNGSSVSVTPTQTNPCPNIANTTTWRWTFTPNVGANTYSLSLTVNVRPANFASCGSLTNSARLVEGAIELDGPAQNPLTNSTVTTTTECFEVNKQIKDPSSGLYVEGPISGGDQGDRVESQIVYKVSGTGALPATITIRDTVAGLDTSGGSPGLQVRLDGSPISSPVAVANVTATSFDIQSLPAGSQPGQHNVTFGMPISLNLCPTTTATNTAIILTYSPAGDSTTISSIHCRIVITGDVGVSGSRDVNVNAFRIKGPGIIVTRGTNIAPSNQGTIDPNTRQLTTYTLPYTTWINLFNMIKGRLLREFAKTLTCSLQDGTCPDLTPAATNPLGVWRYDINPPGNWRIGGNSGTANQFTDARPATIVLVGNPPGGNSLELNGDIRALGTACGNAPCPVALIVETSSDIVIGPGNRTFDHVALIAPNATLDFGTTVRNITWNGLVVVNGVRNLSVPSGSVQFDKSITQYPSPGLAQLVNVTSAENAP